MLLKCYEKIPNIFTYSNNVLLIFHKEYHFITVITKS